MLRQRTLSLGRAAIWAALAVGPLAGPAAAAAPEEARLIGNPRQLTFEGRRAGEGYFSRDGFVRLTPIRLKL